jgi:hypothetical protein
MAKVFGSNVMATLNGLRPAASAIGKAPSIISAGGCCAPGGACQNTCAGGCKGSCTRSCQGRAR